MIVECEKIIIDGVEFDRCIEPSDWRYSAAIVGMVRFFRKFDLSYNMQGRKLYYINGNVDISKDIIRSKYLSYVEEYFADKMHHLVLRELLEKKSLSEEEIKEVKTKLLINAVMKDIFKANKKSFNGDEVGKTAILKKIEEHRDKIISETYRNALTGYRKFANPNKLFSSRGKICRLLGFYVDTGRKTRSLSFSFENKSRNFNDEMEFDFIPFAFTRGRTSIFVNNNLSINSLVTANDYLADYYDRINTNLYSWNTIFYVQTKSAFFNACDVEVIKKDIGVDYYETLMIRKSSLEILAELNEYNEQGYIRTPLDVSLKRSVKVNDEYYINIMDEVTSSILNNICLDGLIDSVMKLNVKKQEREQKEISETFLIQQLIKINIVLYDKWDKLNMEEGMDREKYLNMAYSSALRTVEELKKRDAENKIKGYRQKLTNVLIAKDYNRFIEIMLQLSAYTEISYAFLHRLIADFEDNKNLAYEFVNSLVEKNKIKDEKVGGSSNEK